MFFKYVDTDKSPLSHNYGLCIEINCRPFFYSIDKNKINIYGPYVLFVVFYVILKMKNKKIAIGMFIFNSFVLVIRLIIVVEKLFKFMLKLCDSELCFIGKFILIFRNKNTLSCIPD